jgi:hypothetical protein
MARTGIETYWSSLEKKIIRIDYGIGWDWPDFWESDRLVREMLDSSDSPIDLLMNLEEAEIPSTTLTELPRIARNAAGSTHPRIRRIFLVGTGAYLRTAWELFKQVFPDVASRVVVCNTLADVYSHPDVPPQS